MPPARDGLPVYRFTSFEGLPLRHGITARTSRLPAFGDVSYVTARDPDHARANRVVWSAVIGVDPRRWVCAQQIHGTHVAVVGDQHAGSGSESFADALPGTDALITSTRSLPLAVFCADCVPILIYDPVRRVAAAIHAGWRGTVADVAGETVRTMQREFGSAPGDLIVGIGPSIGPCCYEVGAEVVDAWRAARIGDPNEAVAQHRDRFIFDLWKANALCLASAGVLPGKIDSARICTRCQSDQFFSHRARNGSPGRFAAVIALA